RDVCGIKIFMGSSTGNMLVDNEATLEKIFAEAPTLIAVHCEDEATVQRSLQAFKEKYGEEALQPFMHPLIRTAEACYLSFSKAEERAKEHNTRLYILHNSAAAETALFVSSVPLKE